LLPRSLFVPLAHVITASTMAIQFGLKVRKSGSPTSIRQS